MMYEHLTLMRELLSNQGSMALLNEGMNQCVSIVGVGAVREPPLQAFIPQISNARIYYPVFHFDIEDNKIWVQENTIDIEIDKDLEDMGISKKELWWGSIIRPCVNILTMLSPHQGEHHV